MAQKYANQYAISSKLVARPSQIKPELPTIGNAQIIYVTHMHNLALTMINAILKQCVIPVGSLEKKTS